MPSSTNNLVEGISDLRIGDDTLPSKQIYNPYRDDQYLLPKWKDITSFLHETTADFKIGQLVHLDSFCLYDAMSAIEIMDPKMDTGMVIKEDSHRPFDPSVRLSEREVIFVMDRLLCCETTWLTGQSLSQTLFTCLYCHHVFSLTPENIMAAKGADDPASELVYVVLKAYILATVRCCLLIWREMIKGNVYEEEDFTTNLFGLSLQENYPESDVLMMLEDATTWLENAKKQLFTVDRTRHFDALLDRLRLRNAYLLALIQLSKPNCTGYDEARRELARAAGLVHEGTIAGTMEEGIEAEGGRYFNFLEDHNHSIPILTVSWQRTPHHGPLHCSQIARLALDNLGSLIKRLEAICAVIEFTSVGSLLVGGRHNFITLFASQKPTPCAFSRSKLSSTFYSELRVAGTRPISWLIRDAVLDFSRPPAWWFGVGGGQPPGGDSVNMLPNQQHEVVREVVNGFLERAARVSEISPFIDNVKTNCHNRARLQRILCKLLNTWEALQDEAEQIDAKLHKLAKIDPIVLGLKLTKGEASYPYYLSSWVFHQKLTMMEEILFLGFELELYATHEYLMIYWYLDYVLQCHLQHFERVAAHTEVTEQAAKAKAAWVAAQTAAQTVVQDTRKSKKHKKPKATLISLPPMFNTNNSTQPSLTPPITKPEIDSLRLLNGARQNLCRGIYRVWLSDCTRAFSEFAILALSKTGHFRPPVPRFDDEPTRFSHRFKMFGNLVSPAWLRYEDFAESADASDIKVGMER
ncbi:Mak10 subunit, NatC N-terminal acetyltransferase-domain-containing protein [Endogone sp. FLAS-F59071]|nr:Mak10 subunit, NatC N-terminal acetyltransferase-domain-containing protein [Endogone sp. FLAS-F59071]|eukprot:RUS20438.1 Mak10 subunit, NatC N-terminal acetyltransferase-domain-containing protein [Endogone sp. FLAS-F59071]